MVRCFVRELNQVYLHSFVATVGYSYRIRECPLACTMDTIHQTKNIDGKREYKIHTAIHNGLVTDFGYLLAIMRPKQREVKSYRNHTNSVLPVKVKVIPVVIKTWETIS